MKSRRETLLGSGGGPPGRTSELRTGTIDLSSSGTSSGGADSRPNNRTSRRQSAFGGLGSDKLGGAAPPARPSGFKPTLGISEEQEVPPKSSPSLPPISDEATGSSKKNKESAPLQPLSKKNKESEPLSKKEKQNKGESSGLQKLKKGKTKGFENKHRRQTMSSTPKQIKGRKESEQPQPSQRAEILANLDVETSLGLGGEASESHLQSVRESLANKKRGSTDSSHAVEKRSSVVSNSSGNQRPSLVRGSSFGYHNAVGSTSNTATIRGHLEKRLSLQSDQNKASDQGVRRSSRTSISQSLDGKSGPGGNYQDTSDENQMPDDAESDSGSEEDDDDTRRRSVGMSWDDLQNVDLSDGSFPMWLKMKCANLALDMRFEWLMGFLVTLNCICLGIETEVPEGDEEFESAFQQLERAFLAIFTLELLIVGYGHGIASFKCAQGALDVFIVATGWFFEIIMPLIVAGSGTPDLKWVQLVKMLRALRAVRVLRVLTMFDALWLTVQSFFMCLRPLAWTVLFILMIIYLFAMFAVGLIGRNVDLMETEDEALLESSERFRSTVAAMVTLFQIMTLDEWYAIVGPLFSWSWWPYIFFIVYIAICALALMNLVTAVVVDGAMTQSEAETLAEQERKAFEEHVNKMVTEMEFIFNSFDQDGNGKLCQQEFVDNAMRAPRLESVLSQLGFTNPSDIEQIFQMFLAVESGDDEVLKSSASMTSEDALNAFGTSATDQKLQDAGVTPERGGEVSQELHRKELSMNEFMQGMHLLQIISTDSAWVASIRSAPSSVQRTLRLKRAWDDKRPEGASNNLWEDFGQSKNDMEEKMTELETQISAMRKKNGQALQDLMAEIKQVTQNIKRVPPQPKEGTAPVGSRPNSAIKNTSKAVAIMPDAPNLDKKRGAVAGQPLLHGTNSSSSTDPVVEKTTIAIPAGQETSGLNQSKDSPSPKKQELDTSALGSTKTQYGMFEVATTQSSSLPLMLSEPLAPGEESTPGLLALSIDSSHELGTGLTHGVTSMATQFSTAMRPVEGHNDMSSGLPPIQTASENRNFSKTKSLQESPSNKSSTEPQDDSRQHHLTSSMATQVAASTVLRSVEPDDHTTSALTTDFSIALDSKSMEPTTLQAALPTDISHLAGRASLNEKAMQPAASPLTSDAENVAPLKTDDKGSEESIQRVVTPPGAILLEEEESTDFPGMFPATPVDHNSVTDVLLSMECEAAQPGSRQSHTGLQPSNFVSSGSVEAVTAANVEENVSAATSASSTGPLAEGDRSAGCWISEGDLSAGRGAPNPTTITSEGDLSAGTTSGQLAQPPRQIGNSGSSTDVKAGAPLTLPDTSPELQTLDRSMLQTPDRSMTPFQLDRAWTPLFAADEDLQHTRNEVLALTSTTSRSQAGGFMRWMAANRPGWQQHRTGNASAEIRRQLHEVSAGSGSAMFLGGTTILGGKHQPKAGMPTTVSMSGSQSATTPQMDG